MLYFLNLKWDIQNVHAFSDNEESTHISYEKMTNKKNWKLTAKFLLRKLWLTQKRFFYIYFISNLISNNNSWKLWPRRSVFQVRTSGFYWIIFSQYEGWCLCGSRYWRINEIRNNFYQVRWRLKMKLRASLQF